MTNKLEAVAERKKRLNELVQEYGFNTIAQYATIKPTTLGVYCDAITEKNAAKCVSNDKLELLERRLRDAFIQE